MFTNSTDREVRDKLTLIYIMARFNVPLSYQQLTEFVMGLELMNYFTMLQYITEMKDTGLIEENHVEDEELVMVTKDGHKTLSMFSERISASTAEMIEAAIEVTKSKMAKERQIKATYMRINDNEFNVHLEMLEGDNHLMNLKFLVFFLRNVQKCFVSRGNAMRLIYMVTSFIKSLKNNKSVYRTHLYETTETLFSFFLIYK